MDGGLAHGFACASEISGWPPEKKAQEMKIFAISLQKIFPLEAHTGQNASHALGRARLDFSL
jgi:hypothetical protein